MTESSQTVSPELVDALASVLDSDEQVVWQGRPRRGLVPVNTGTMIFSFVWCAFACFWETTVLYLYLKGGAKRPPVFFVLWGIPFVLVGLYMVAGRFLVDAWNRGRTFYVLTNRRALIIRGRQGRSLTSLELTGLREVRFTEHRDGTGTIMMNPPEQGQKTASWPASSDTPACPAFEHISDARQVFRLLRPLPPLASLTAPQA
jgi:hypothetical protein